MYVVSEELGARHHVGAGILLETESNDHHERAILVGVSLPGISNWEMEDSLDELSLLADTAGMEVVDLLVQERPSIDPAFFIGRGKVDLLRETAKRRSADLVIFDDDLSPAQARNLERVVGVRILDRSGLILDIFVGRARTKEAKTQVELAQLEYLMPRLTRQWPHLSRQAGGGGTMGMGGIGTRGPGETQLEVDRRKIRKRIKDLSKELDRIGRRRAVGRKARKDLFKTALVGYTNAGKSTLMRVLSGSLVFVEDRLFATLDSTTRLVKFRGNQKMLITDTVGFIRKLPHHLIASFHSTLEEAIEADLLLHVVDISHPQFEEQILAVRVVLDELGILEKPTLMVFNKVDLLEETGLLTWVKEEYSDSVAVSASTGFGLEDLRSVLERRIDQGSITLDLSVSQKDGGFISLLYDAGEVLEQSYQGNEVLLKVRMNRQQAQRMSARLRAYGGAVF